MGLRQRRRYGIWCLNLLIALKGGAHVNMRYCCETSTVFLYKFFDIAVAAVCVRRRQRGQQLGDAGDLRDRPGSAMFTGGAVQLFFGSVCNEPRDENTSARIRNAAGQRSINDEEQRTYRKHTAIGRKRAGGKHQSVFHPSPGWRNQANSIALRACMRTGRDMTPQFAPCCSVVECGGRGQEGRVVSFNPPRRTRFGRARDRLPRGFRARCARGNRSYRRRSRIRYTLRADQASLSDPAMPRPAAIAGEIERPGSGHGFETEPLSRSSGEHAIGTIDGDGR